MKNSWNNLNPQKCDWCPLVCGANRACGKFGLCGANDNVYVARSALHYWEEPPISGIIGGSKRDIGPGSGTIFFSNCNMKCIYCQNYEISGVNKNVIGKSVSLNDLVNMCLNLQNLGAMNINFVTGTHYRSHIISAVRKAKKEGLCIPIVWNSSCYETSASIYSMVNTVDVWLPDFKYWNNQLSLKYSGNKISNYSKIAMEAIEAMLDLCEEAKFDIFNENTRIKSGIIVRHMMLPGHIEDSKNVIKNLFENFGNQIKYSIMNQYTPVIKRESKVASRFPQLLDVVNNSDYEELLDYADSLGIKDYYWQNGPACSQSFIPQWG